MENQTYSYYFTIKELPQFIFFSVWLVIIFSILHILSTISGRFKCLKCFSDYFKNPTVEVAFSAMLKRDDDDFTIFNEKVPALYTDQLYTMALTLIGVALIQFWDDFLIEESHTCSTNPQIACFPVFPDMDTPRLNCSTTDITSVICYRFVFRIGSAAASALGVVTVTSLAVYFFNFVSVKILKLGEKKNRRKVLTAMIIRLFFGIIILAGIVGVSYLKFNSSTTRADQATEILKIIYVGSALFSSNLYNPWDGLCYTYCSNLYARLLSIQINDYVRMMPNK